MAVLITILLILMGLTAQKSLYPTPPKAWERVHSAPALPMADVNKMLSDSGAIIESVKALPDGTVENWQLRHRTGQWKLTVNLKKTPAGVMYRSSTITCEISHLPSFTRTWEYPEL